MKEPKIYRRSRYGIFEIVYYIYNKRKLTSLKTSNEVKARVKFTEITGLSAPIKKNNSIPVLTQPSKEDNFHGAKFVKSYHSYFKSKWGMENAWSHKPKGQCTIDLP